MADEDNKEEKFEFTSDGEVVGYISLEQARLRAMQHARDNPDFYGRRYAQRDLVWEVVGEEKSEDYYQVRVSYRPTRGFTGQPGVEEFTVDKTGPIEFRQIISEPRQASRSLVVASGVAIIVVAAVFGILLGSGMLDSNSSRGLVQLLDAHTTSVELVPYRSARLKSDEGDVTVFVSSGSVETPAVLRYEEVSVKQIPPMDRLRVAIRAFELSVTKKDGSGSVPFLRNPLLISVQLSAEDLSLAGGVDSLREPDINKSGFSTRVKIMTFRGEYWEPSNTRLNLDTFIAEARVPRLGLFALAFVDRSNR